jgi:hypothetical protein
MEEVGMRHPHKCEPYRRTHDPGSYGGGSGMHAPGFGGGGGAVSGTKSDIGAGSGDIRPG